MNEKEAQLINSLHQKIAAGEVLSLAKRRWLRDHPIPSPRFGAPYFPADMLPVPPGVEVPLLVKCIHMEHAYPTVPTFTIPSGTSGYMHVDLDFHKELGRSTIRKSTKLSLRLAQGQTALLRIKSDSGLILVSYQGWFSNASPIPRWSESLSSPELVMTREMANEQSVQYFCSGPAPESEEEGGESFWKYVFQVTLPEEATE